MASHVKSIPVFCLGTFGLVLWGLGIGRLDAQQASGPDQKVAPSAASAPVPAAGRQPWPVRLKDGQPDVQAVWDPTGGRGTPGACSGTNLEAWRETRGKTTRDVPGCVVEPPDGVIPYLPWARARRDEVRDHYLAPTAAQMDTRTRGWPDGLPRQNYYQPFQILQPPGAVVILYEVQHEFRYIPVDGRPHADPAIKSFLGSSRGRWEGTTLVVDVTNISDRVRLSSVGDFASDALRITERWKFVDADTLELSVTLDDPNVYSRPWTLVKKLVREKNPAFELMEYAGVEGDRDASLMVEIRDNVREQKEQGK